jgi:hypothetical protein
MGVGGRTQCVRVRVDTASFTIFIPSYVPIRCKGFSRHVWTWPTLSLCNTFQMTIVSHQKKDSTVDIT